MMEYYSAVKRKECTTEDTPLWMDLKLVTLSQNSQMLSCASHPIPLHTNRCDRECLSGSPGLWGEEIQL